MGMRVFDEFVLLRCVGFWSSLSCFVGCGDDKSKIQTKVPSNGSSALL
jgi:hypothetical protein